MAEFARRFRPEAETTILDVGGSLFNWALVDSPSQIAILNLTYAPGSHAGAADNFTFLRGDGTRLPFCDQAFHIAYSNSVVEHLFTFEQQQTFAAELSRIADGLWIQTPARPFPIEPHYLTPFIHFMPKSWQRRLLRNFTVWGWMTRPTQQRVDATVEEIRLVTFKEMQVLFPDCEIEREKFLFLTKSYIAIRAPRGPQSPAPTG